MLRYFFRSRILRILKSQLVWCIDVERKLHEVLLWCFCEMRWDNLCQIVGIKKLVGLLCWRYTKSTQCAIMLCQAHSLRLPYIISDLNCYLLWILNKTNMTLYKLNRVYFNLLLRYICIKFMVFAFILHWFKFVK